MQTSVGGDEPSLCSWTITSSRENGSCGFNMQLMVHLITCSSLHFHLTVSLHSLLLSLVSTPVWPYWFAPTRAPDSLAFSYLFAQLMCNTALTHCPDNEVETSCTGWMKSTAILFQLLCSRESGHVTRLAKQHISTLPCHTNTRDRYGQIINSPFISINKK